MPKSNHHARVEYQDKVYTYTARTNGRNSAADPKFKGIYLLVTRTCKSCKDHASPYGLVTLYEKSLKMRDWPRGWSKEASEKIRQAMVKELTARGTLKDPKAKKPVTKKAKTKAKPKRSPKPVTVSPFAFDAGSGEPPSDPPSGKPLPPLSALGVGTPVEEATPAPIPPDRTPEDCQTAGGA